MRGIKLIIARSYGLAGYVRVLPFDQTQSDKHPAFKSRIAVLRSGLHTTCSRMNKFVCLKEREIFTGLPVKPGQLSQLPFLLLH